MTHWKFWRSRKSGDEHADSKKPSVNVVAETGFRAFWHKHIWTSSKDSELQRTKSPVAEKTSNHQVDAKGSTSEAKREHRKARTTSGSSSTQPHAPRSATATSSQIEKKSWHRARWSRWKH